MDHDRLERQINFIIEIDKVKSIFRKTILIDGTRNENDAEHSWHIGIMAFLLQEHVDEEVDITRVVKMALIHDLVEIYAGDTYCYDQEAAKDKLLREKLSAEKVFGLLPADQAQEFHDLWEEFEACISAEARFAAALDRLQPLIHNYLTKGRTWQENGITKSQVLKRNEQIQYISMPLWNYIQSIIELSVQKGYLSE